MPSLLRNMLPVSISNSKKTHDNDDDEEEYSVEYSFAMEYSGPPLPVSYDIPQVVPLDVNRIPTASVFSSSLNNLSLPVIQPIVKRANNLNRRSSKRSKLDSEVASRRHLGEDRGSSRVLVSNSVDVTEQECPLEGQENGSLGVSDGTGSSGTLGFSDSRDESNELSGSSDLEEPACSSEITPDEVVGDCISEASDQGNGVKAASTFYEPRRSDIESQSSDLISEEGATHERERPAARSDLKKGLCHRCHKGSRFTDKEVCIVCGAKYCSGCLLRAMGSMPEGRKCITCIGYSIDEARRRSLGKSSKMLKRLLTKEEIKQILRLETSCEVNQLPPNLVSINGRALSVDDLHHLQNCRYPPKKLKPGNYWYDKVSGFWGKEGEKPSQIICAEMDIGGTIQQNASNGNTNVLINGREITKLEQWMLQLVGIHCEGQPHFWLSADGSYLLEGQKNVMGKLWEQPRVKLVCAALSLPFPPESRDEADKIGSDNLDQKAVKKILLVGCDQSGTSTLFKQTKIMYDVPFTEDERQNFKFMIQNSLYRYIAILLEAREQFEEEYLEELKRELINQPGPSGYSDQIEEKNVYALSPGPKAFSEWLLQVKRSGNLEVIFPTATCEYAPRIEELLNDSGFRAAYNRRNELYALPSVTNYFLDQAVEICRVDYEPSDTDILYAEGITPSNGVASTEFSFPAPIQDGYMESVDQNDPFLSCRYQLIRVHSSSLGENCKWLGMFEDVDLVLFCVSLTNYDEVDINNGGVCTNKMLASKKLFETIITHPTFARKDFLLVLNKFDLFEEKLKRVPLNQCEWFQDFNPVITQHSNKGNNNHSNNAGSPGQRAFHYIAVQFKRLFRDLVGRKLYVAPTIGLESGSVDEALKYGREILKWEEEKPSGVRNEWSSESIEASTTS